MAEDQQEPLSYLVLAYLSEELSDEQRTRLDSWTQQSPVNRSWLLQWKDLHWVNRELHDYSNINIVEAKDNIWSQIARQEQLEYEQLELERLQPEETTDYQLEHEEVHPEQSDLERKSSSWWRWFGSVAAIALVTIGWHWFNVRSANQQGSAHADNKQNKTSDPRLQSARDKHVNVLTTNTSELTLDSLSDGVIYVQAGLEVIKRDSFVSYRMVNQDSTAGMAFHTITTGKGRSYVVLLPDSSTAWLNETSSIRFPLAFTNGQRPVIITGEVLMDVHPDKLKPFIAIANKITVEALGTRFNVNAYQKTKKITLLQGKIKIKEGLIDTVLTRVGSVAVVDSNANFHLEHSGDTAIAVDWQKGEFNFKTVLLTDALAEIARWYDVKIRYIDTPDIRLTNSSFPRDRSLDAAIKLLNQANHSLSIRIQDSVLVVSYKRSN